jgi:ornithine cyclodeaminase
MLFVSEAESAALTSHEMAREAVRQALIDVCDARTETFPVVHGHGSNPTNRFTVKAAAAREVAGLKVGSYWPGNLDIGLPRHNSLILLFDQEKGRIGAAIEAGTLNAYRTAAADAVAAEALARRDAETLAIFGAGHQARYECAAVAKVRLLRLVLVVARNPDQGKAMIADLAAQGITAQAASAEAACAAADIIVTATSATAPLFKAEWVRPGTHVASMGSDARGKQELPPELIARASLFCDLPSQSRIVGEFQHAPEGVDLIAIGEVLAGRHPGRRFNHEITVFDSSGLAVQDLYIARHLLAKHEVLHTR